MPAGSLSLEPEMLLRTARGDWRAGEALLAAAAGTGSVCELALEERRGSGGRAVASWRAWRAMAAGEGSGGLISW